MSNETTLYFIHDPMCSWCWAFRPVWQTVRRELPAGMVSQRLLGGLAPDSADPMPLELQEKLQTTWRTIQQQVPGTEFNFDFWARCKPRRATYPACRAVIAARAQGEAYEESMILAIQQAYYLQARNPSDDATLIGLAGEIGLDAKCFGGALALAHTQAQLEREIAQGRSLGVNSFPSLVLVRSGTARRIRHDYLDAEAVLRQLA